MVLFCSFFIFWENLVFRPWCQTFCQSLNGSPGFPVILWNASEVTILDLERCGFLHFEVYLVSDNFLFLFFSIRKFCAPSVNFFQFFSKFWKKIFFIHFFLKRIRCSKYKQQGILKVLISYQMQNLQCSFCKIATCEAFLITTKILSFSKKKSETMHHTKQSHESKHSFSTFYISLPNFKALGSIIKKKS